MWLGPVRSVLPTITRWRLSQNHTLPRKCHGTQYPRYTSPIFTQKRNLRTHQGMTPQQYQKIENAKFELKKIQSSLGKRPEDPELHYKKGKCLFSIDEDKFTEALECFNTAIQLIQKLDHTQPSWAKDCYSSIILINKKLGHTDKLIEAYRQYLVQDPQSLTHWTELGPYFYSFFFPDEQGDILNEQEETSQAAECWRTCVELNPRNALANLRLSECLFYTGFFEESLNYLNVASSLAPNNLSILETKLHYLKTLGLYEDVENTCREAFKSNIHSLPLHEGLVTALLVLEKPKEALSFCKELIKTHPSANTLILKSLAENQNGHYKNAITDLNEAILRDPQNLTAHFKKAETFAELRQYDLAMGAVKKAIQIPHSSPLPHALKASLHFRRQEIREALEDCEEALKLDPECEEAQRTKEEILSSLVAEVLPTQFHDE